MEWNGKKIPADQINTSTVTFDGDKYALRAGEKVTSSGTIKFDPSKSPMTFDATVAEGEGRGKPCSASTSATATPRRPACV